MRVQYKKGILLWYATDNAKGVLFAPKNFTHIREILGEFLEILLQAKCCMCVSGGTLINCFHYNRIKERGR